MCLYAMLSRDDLDGVPPVLGQRLRDRRRPPSSSLPPCSSLLLPPARGLKGCGLPGSSQSLCQSPPSLDAAGLLLRREPRSPGLQRRIAGLPALVRSLRRVRHPCLAAGPLRQLAHVPHRVFLAGMAAAAAQEWRLAQPGGAGARPRLVPEVPVAVRSWLEQGSAPQAKPIWGALEWGTHGALPAWRGGGSAQESMNVQPECAGPCFGLPPTLRLTRRAVDGRRSLSKQPASSFNYTDTERASARAPLWSLLNCACMQLCLIPFMRARPLCRNAAVAAAAHTRLVARSGVGMLPMLLVRLCLGESTSRMSSAGRAGGQAGQAPEKVSCWSRRAGRPTTRQPQGCTARPSRRPAHPRRRW